MIMIINITKSMVFPLCGKNEGITFPDYKNPSMLGFNGFHVESGYVIAYNMLGTVLYLTISDGEEKIVVGDKAFDLSPGKQLIIIYVNKIEYHYVGYTEAPVFSVNDSKHHLKSDNPC